MTGQRESRRGRGCVDNAIVVGSLALGVRCHNIDHGDGIIVGAYLRVGGVMAPGCAEWPTRAYSMVLGARTPAINTHMEDGGCAGLPAVGE